MTTGVQFVTELVSGRLNLYLVDSSTTMLQIGDNLHNGNWYELDVFINGGSALTVELGVIGDNTGFLPIQQNITRSPDTSLDGPVVLGSITDLSPSFSNNPNSFSGCIRMLYINEIATNLNVDASQFVTPGCPREENCNLDPCANGSVCMSTWNDFSCSCSADFTGTDCSECEL